MERLGQLDQTQAQPVQLRDPKFNALKAPTTVQLLAILLTSLLRSKRKREKAKERRKREE